MYAEKEANQRLTSALETSNRKHEASLAALHERAAVCYTDPAEAVAELRTPRITLKQILEENPGTFGTLRTATETRMGGLFKRQLPPSLTDLRALNQAAIDYHRAEGHASAVRSDAIQNLRKHGISAHFHEPNLGPVFESIIVKIDRRIERLDRWDATHSTEWPAERVRNLWNRANPEQRAQLLAHPRTEHRLKQLGLGRERSIGL